MKDMVQPFGLMCYQIFTSICALKKKSAPLLPKWAVKCTPGSIANSKEDANQNKRKEPYSQKTYLSEK